MEIKKNFRNDLLKRKEILFVVEKDSNPGFEGVKQIAVDNFKTEAENVAVKFVKNNFGTHEFLVEVFVYDSKSDKERVEPKVKVKAAEGGK